MLRRPMRRDGMPLVRATATTAVVAGTAGAVHHHQEQKSADRAAQQQAQAPRIASAPVAGGVTDEAIAQVQKLAELRKAGIITQEEFDAKKKHLLGL